MEELGTLVQQLTEQVSASSYPLLDGAVVVQALALTHKALAERADAEAEAIAAAAEAAAGAAAEAAAKAAAAAAAGNATPDVDEPKSPAASTTALEALAARISFLEEQLEFVPASRPEAESETSDNAATEEGPAGEDGAQDDEQKGEAKGDDSGGGDGGGTSGSKSPAGRGGEITRVARLEERLSLMAHNIQG